MDPISVILGVASLAFSAVSTGVKRKKAREEAEANNQLAAEESRKEREKARTEFDITESRARADIFDASQKQKELDTEQLEMQDQAMEDKRGAIDEMQRNEFDSLAPQQLQGIGAMQERDSGELERAKGRINNGGGFDALR